ncbi:hypothetical protein EMIHUDRAFT_235704, partial [Emiliania huxleyi CCMP1516]|uniref:Right handed beta helix domain-containing protein n=2 Tax=Emiliania huxleyi TaxID=2903 RepID=A0A0D3JVF7_EMIH1
MSTISGPSDAASDGVAQEAAGAGPVPGPQAPQGTAAQADGSREALPFEDVEACWKGRRDEWRDEVVGAAGSAVDLAGLLAELLCSLTAAAVSYLWRSRGQYDKLYGELYDLASGRRSDPVAATLRRLVAAVETAALPPADARERQLKVVQLPPAEAAEGAAVQVYFSDEERWYRGTVTAVNGNKTFTVLFEDGDEDASYEGWAAKWDEWVQRDSGRLRLYRPDELTLSSLPDELACSLSLRRASAVCRSWRARLRRGQRDADRLFESAWLNLPVVDPLDGRVCLGVAAALSRAPAGERAVHLVADAGAALCDGTLHLHGGEGGLVEGLAISHDLPREGGLVEGLAISHFRDEAVVVHTGTWTLRGCSIASSRKSRAVTAVTVRPGAALRLESCSVRNALSAAMLHDGAELRAVECVFDNTRTGVISRGGHLELERCRVEAPCDVVLKLNPRTTGHATANR